MIPYDAPRLPVVTVPIPSPPHDDEALLAAVVARGEGTPKSAGGVLLFTVLLFHAFGGLNWDWKSMVFITIAVGLHELGHVLAMRALGYKNVRMLFVPLFGGLATGEPRELTAGTLTAGTRQVLTLDMPLPAVISVGRAATIAHRILRGAIPRHQPGQLPPLLV
ncbi:MAG: hypothetical protein Q8N18_17655 [Opitutaceae bacterium]|nr:hypothetical protein [Opitutaceae bacterium]